MTYYSRRQVMELLEIEEGFLVLLEREDIVLHDAPPESEGDFSDRMLERVRVAQNLVRDLEVNLPGVAVIVRLREEMAGLRRHVEDLRSQLGQKSGVR
jgi:MerR family transcriptional regulator/heat shock protein HspR